MEDALDIDLSDLDTRMHFAGFGGAVGAYLISALGFTGQLDILQLGTFLAAFFPVMYSFEIVLKSLEEED